MKFAVIALRNLARHRRRTLLSLLVIAAGAVALILTTGFIRFSFDGLREALIHGGLGHLELMPAATAAATGPDRSAPPAFADWARVREIAESTRTGPATAISSSCARRRTTSAGTVPSGANRCDSSVRSSTSAPRFASSGC